MKPARWPLDDVRATRMLRLDTRLDVLHEGLIGDLVHALSPGDLLVVNDAATLPASLRAVFDRGALEVRLLGPGSSAKGWRAVTFGPGDWRTRTEDRPSPPSLSPGDVLAIGALRATVRDGDDATPRLVTLDFDLEGAALWCALYQEGQPVQYAYVDRPLALWHVQTAYAARPWAAEAPSAGLPLTWDLLIALRRRGVGLARVTHAAGLSSTGDPALDARLPLAERYEIPDETVRAIAACTREGGRVVAVGTTVARALEGAARANGGTRAPGEGVTDLRLGPNTERLVIKGLLTGLHDEGTSHFSLLEAFAPRALLARANALAEARGWRGHELGDVMLVLAS